MGRRKKTHYNKNQQTFKFMDEEKSETLPKETEELDLSKGKRGFRVVGGDDKERITLISSESIEVMVPYVKARRKELEIKQDAELAEAYLAGYEDKYKGSKLMRKGKRQMENFGQKFRNNVLGWDSASVAKKKIEEAKQKEAEAAAKKKEAEDAAKKKAKAKESTEPVTETPTGDTEPKSSKKGAAPVTDMTEKKLKKLVYESCSAAIIDVLIDNGLNKDFASDIMGMISGLEKKVEELTDMVGMIKIKPSTGEVSVEEDTVVEPANPSTEEVSAVSNNGSEPVKPSAPPGYDRVIKPAHPPH